MPHWSVRCRALSHGEQIMARFFAAVWLGENKFDFDLVDAGATLDPAHRQVIGDWLTNPVFPLMASKSRNLQRL